MLHSVSYSHYLAIEKNLSSFTIVGSNYFKLNFFISLDNIIPRAVFLNA